MNASINNGSLGKHLSDIRQHSHKHRMLRRLAALSLPLLLIAMGLSLSGCATQPIPCDPVPPPIQPAMLTETPSQSYSTSVAKLLSEWQARLMGMSATKPP